MKMFLLKKFKDERTPEVSSEEQSKSASTTINKDNDYLLTENVSSKILLDKVEEIAAKKYEWEKLSAKKKLELLDEIMDRLKNNLDKYHEAVLKKRDCFSVEKSSKELIKMHDAATTLNWLHSAGLLAAWLSIIREYFESIVCTGMPPKPAKISKNYDNTSFVSMNLSGLLMKFLTTFGLIELHVEGNVEQGNNLENKGGLVVVLGAGNYDAPIDILSAMFIENKVCIYKFSPLSLHLLEPLENVFYPLVRDGYLMLSNGGVEEGNLLISHPKVDKWFLTGSKTTANLILWGHPEPPKSLDEKPKIQKDCMLELGNCTPWIVCPGNWSSLELICHAKHMAMAMLYNGGHICVHPQLIITCKNWPQREQFLNYVCQYQEATPIIGSFYPDYKKRYDAAQDSFMLEGISEEDFSLNVSVANNHIIDPSYRKVFFAKNLKPDTFLTREEMFCNVCGEVPLDVENSFEVFLNAAVKFCNENCSGNLAVSISAKACNDSQKKALDKAVVDLKYGSISVNVFPIMPIIFANLIWGAYPGGSIHRFESGIGFLGNCYAYKRPIKSVFKAPFLNMCHVLVVLPTSFTGGRLSKLWRRACYALLDRRGADQSYWCSFVNTMKLGLAMIFNL